MQTENSFYGISREDEQQKLKEIRDLAQRKVESTREAAAALQEELKSLREVYDVEDKEGMAQWFNTDARFAEVRNNLNRSIRACHKPYFGRIDIEDPESHKRETFYIGKSLITDDPAHPLVIDWRAPISSVYYDHSLGLCEYKVPQKGSFFVDLKRKRTYEIEDDRILDYYDSDVVANDDLLTKYLSKSKRNVLSEIIATIQQEQNEVIRFNPHHNVLIQGSAGSGKTTVAMHRISYILYNYDREFTPDSFYVVGSNKILLNYITGVLPDLDVYGVRQMTMEELFIRLLYEEWDRRKYRMRTIDKKDEGMYPKAGSDWFHALRRFCDEKERAFLPQTDICIESNGHVILPASAVDKVFHDYPAWTLLRKAERLNDLLMSGLENELYGKNYSYNAEEQKRLIRKFTNWFNRFFPKESVFSLYEEFVEQMRVGHPGLTYVSDEPDLYDLASLAYVYKRLKETQVIQEASHVVIDEAQDFGLSVYLSLTYCMSKCTFTVMGDVSQNIHFHLGLGDWEELKKVLLPDPYDYFGLLRKSYRNTVEISNFATDILRHASFPIYPVEPIIRHGEKVSVQECKNETVLLSKVLEKASAFKDSGYETIAIICKDQKEAKKVCHALSPELEVSLFSEGSGEFAKGIYALPIEYSKGLEFDAVIIYDASAKAYPKDDGYAKLLYVAATRALHELAVFSKGALTGLIKDPIPEDRKNLSFAVDSFHKKPLVKEEECKTQEEIVAEHAAAGNSERAFREKYGPRKIVISTQKAVSKTPVRKDTRRVRISSPTGYMSDFQVAPAKSLKVSPNVSQTPYSLSHAQKKSPSVQAPCASEFGTMPEGTSLAPIGHGKIDVSVRWVDHDKRFVEITSNYGALRIIPIAEETVRILFSRGGFSKIKALPAEIIYREGLRWTYQESRDAILICLAKLKIRITKKTGALEFLSAKDNLLLSENNTLPRQYHGSQDIWWEFFTWSRKENLTVRGATDEIWKEIGQSARYISHSTVEDRPALIMSSKGYQLLVPGAIKTLLCTIPAYGPYLCFEDTEYIDYIFRTK